MHREVGRNNKKAKFFLLVYRKRARPNYAFITFYQVRYMKMLDCLVASTSSRIFSVLIRLPRKNLAYSGTDAGNL